MNDLYSSLSRSIDQDATPADEEGSPVQPPANLEAGVTAGSQNPRSNSAAKPVKGVPKNSPKRRKKETRPKRNEPASPKRSGSGSASRTTKEKPVDPAHAAKAPEPPQENGIKHSGFHRTDAGNAELFASLFGKRIRYDHKRGRWLIYSLHWWVEDKGEQVIQLAKDAARYRLQHSADLADDEARKAEASWALASESKFRLEAAVRLAKTEPPLSDNGESWDRDPWLLGVANGVIDLRTGKLREGKPEDKITMHTNVPYDPEAKSQPWAEFLDKVFGGNQELIDYVQRCFGYSLTGLTREEVVFYAYGTGANGKSTFLEAIRYAVGPYAGAAPFSMLEHKNKASIPSDVAATVGKRFITASETDESTRLNESRIKAMTGGDKQVARFMYKDWFEFVATAKIWLAFNHKPEISDDSHGMWRRVRVIPFNKKFEGSEQDRTLKERLQAAAPAILAWAVQGAVEYLKRGLVEPRAVIEATEAYRKESDTLSDFLDERCNVGEALSVSSNSLWGSYTNWAAENGVTWLDRRAFANRLESRGYKRRKVGHERTRSFRGLALKSIPDNNSAYSSDSVEGDEDADPKITEKLSPEFDRLLPG